MIGDHRSDQRCHQRMASPTDEVIGGPKLAEMDFAPVFQMLSFLAWIAKLHGMHRCCGTI